METMLGRQWQRIWGRVSGWFGMWHLRHAGFWGDQRLLAALVGRVLVLARWMKCQSQKRRPVPSFNHEVLVANLSFSIERATLPWSGLAFRSSV